jgi:tight adherence protein B
MSAAALALAMALLVLPVSSRHRVQRPSTTRRAVRRIPLSTGVCAAALALAVVAPIGVVVAAGLIGGTLGMRRRRRVRQRGRETESAALQGALDVLVGELRVGAHPVAAFGAAAGEVDGAVAASLRVIAARARMGADVAGGLRDAGRRSPLPAHWESLAACWQLAQSHGLAIATLMQTAQRDIVERERFTARVIAGMAGARTTAGVLAGLPVVGIGLGQLIGANPLEFLLRGGAGGWLLVVGVALACAGLVWSDRITDGVVG